MVAPQLKETAATRVVFRLHGIPDEQASREAKHLVVKDIEVCDISFAGNKTTAGTFPANDIADWFDDPETGYRRERTYKEKYSAEYDAFKRGESYSLAGTPLEALNISENKRKELRAANVYTVEALASLDGAALKSLGMGGRDLKDKAVELLDKMGSGTALTDMRVQMDAMQAEIDRLRNSAGEPSPIAQAVKEAEELAQTDAKKGGSLAGQDTTKDASEVADELSETRKAFADFTDEDLELWLTEGGVDVKIDGRWSDERKRNELLLLAKEQLAKNAKKKT